MHAVLVIIIINLALSEHLLLQLVEKKKKDWFLLNMRAGSHCIRSWWLNVQLNQSQVTYTEQKSCLHPESFSEIHSNFLKRAASGYFPHSKGFSFFKLKINGWTRLENLCLWVKKKFENLKKKNLIFIRATWSIFWTLSSQYKCTVVTLQVLWCTRHIKSLLHLETKPLKSLH